VDRFSESLEAENSAFENSIKCCRRERVNRSLPVAVAVAAVVVVRTAGVVVAVVVVAVVGVAVVAAAVVVAVVAAK